MQQLEDYIQSDPQYKLIFASLRKAHSQIPNVQDAVQVLSEKGCKPDWLIKLKQRFFKNATTPELVRSATSALGKELDGIVATHYRDIAATAAITELKENEELKTAVELLQTYEAEIRACDPAKPKKLKKVANHIAVKSKPQETAILDIVTATLTKYFTFYNAETISVLAKLTKLVILNNVLIISDMVADHPVFMYERWDMTTWSLLLYVLVEVELEQMVFWIQKVDSHYNMQKIDMNELSKMLSKQKVGA